MILADIETVWGYTLRRGSGCLTNGVHLRPIPTSRTARATTYELLDPAAGPRRLAENGKWVRDRLARNGVPQEAIEKHLSVIGNPPEMEAALTWYRARGERQPIAPTYAITHDAATVR